MEYVIFIGAIVALLIVLKLLAWPIKKILKVLINVVIGIILLFIFNSFSMAWFGFFVPINWITALVVGLLGIPGFIIVLLFVILL